jgi:hypothetical protein
MTPPATLVAGPSQAATTDTPAVVAALRGELQDLRHAIAFNLPALLRVHDDPCKPAQRVLLGEVIDGLRAAIENKEAGE